MSQTFAEGALEAIVESFLKTAASVVDQLEDKTDPTSKRAYTTLVTAGGLIDALHEGNKALARRANAKTPPTVGAIALGMAVVCGLFGRGRYDVIQKLADDVLFARYTAELVRSVPTKVDDAADRAALSAHFVAILDELCALPEDQPS